MVSGDRGQGFRTVSTRQRLVLETRRVDKARTNGRFHIYVVDNVRQGNPAAFRLIDLPGGVPAGSPCRTNPLRALTVLETLTMHYVHWYGNERHSQLSNFTPEEYEQAYYASTTGSPSGDAAHKETA
jgi:hypothetical protein